MPGAYLTIELDTRPPVISWDDPVREGSGVRIPYSINEPALLAADIDGVLAVIENDNIFASVQRQQGGQVTVRTHVKDDVDNEAVYTHVLWLNPVQGTIRKSAKGAAPDRRGGSVDQPKTGHVEKPDEGDAF